MSRKGRAHTFCVVEGYPTRTDVAKVADLVNDLGGSAVLVGRERARGGIQ